MELKEFTYGEKPRKLLVLEETSTSYKGIEVSLIPESTNDKGEPLPAELQESAKLINMAKAMKASATGKLSDKDFALLKPYIKFFRNYSKEKCIFKKDDVDKAESKGV